jgi:pyruvate dehydrogenase E2 component (dihydrolipoamide acetyltransferase)
VSASVSVSVPASASSSAPVARSSDDRVFASPFAKKLAREAGVTLGAVGGSGPKGRVIAADVLAAISNGAIQPEGVASTPPIVASVASAPTAATTEGIVVAPVSSTVEYTDYPISQEAQLFAQQLTQQKLNVPHYHLSIDLTLDKLLHAREQLNAERKEEEKLSVNDFILRAASLAMKKIPQVTSTWKETFIRQFHEVNINLIVSSHGGILNPVIKRVDTKGLDEINQTVRSIMTKATTTTKESFFPNDFTNGTFTISNVGMYDVRSLAAIVSPNQACSLGIGTIEKKIVPNDGKYFNF